MRRHKTHLQFLKNSGSLLDAAKPAKFSIDTKWEDWVQTFLNYLCLYPGQDGVPIKYICHSNDLPDPTPQPDFLDEYVNMAPLTGEAFVIDTATVHTLIVNLISGNTVAELKIQLYESNKNGRLD